MDKPLAQEEIDALFAAARTRGSNVKERPANERVNPSLFPAADRSTTNKCGLSVCSTTILRGT